ncbi:type II toxin-antitoxin system HicA family toxin [Janthinobacterium sp. TND4EL3]|uniref:type II toxin-antitoxin system HicA family toxin n=1 Tax=Janthinobacterium sp. TND4EL3 TaxID=1907311 RepID=UPI0009708209|nr:type II toxin-antitoxin system HicA family toxin [Janthinobacterium sp. TND4EL3]
MSKSVKLLSRLRQIPADFTWDELVTALTSIGFKDISDKPGSYRTFIFVASGIKIFLHKPHPAKIMKRYALREIVAKLDELGL